jgi:hypothetical protein
MPRQRKKTNAEYHAEKVAAARRLLQNETFYEKDSPASLEWAKEFQRQAGFATWPSKEPAETAEVQERYAAGRKAAQQNIFDGRAAASGKDE